MSHQIDAVIALLRSAIDALSDLRDKADGARRLGVPWLSQLGPDAAYSNADCGPACVAMWLRWLGQVVTVDQASKATGLPHGYKYTVPAQLVAAAGKFGLALRREFGLTPAVLRDEIASGSPAIVLVHYPDLPRRYDPKFATGHYILVVGSTDKTLLYHDSYWPDSTGQFMAIEDAALERAMQNCERDGNTPRQGLVKA